MQEGAANLKSPSLDASEPKDTTWDVAGGLDSLMLSVSNSNLSSLSGSKEATSSIAPAAPEQEREHVFPTFTTDSLPAAVTSPSPPLPLPSIGSLSVGDADAVFVGDVGTSRTATSFLGSSSFAPKKSSLASKKGIGARKLVDSSSLDVKMDSFEVVEKNAAKAAQEDEDHKLALKLQTAESGTGSSRLAAVYQDSESLYRAPPMPSISSSIYSSARSGPTLGAPSSSNNAGESYQARERFSSSKSISSDQFFGRDEEDNAAARTRLQHYSNATAISSDMLNSGSGPRGSGSTSQGSSNSSGSSSASTGDVGLGKLKESVRDFFARSF